MRFPADLVAKGIKGINCHPWLAQYPFAGNLSLWYAFVMEQAEKHREHIQMILVEIFQEDDADAAQKLMDMVDAQVAEIISICLEKK